MQWKKNLPFDIFLCEDDDTEYSQVSNHLQELKGVNEWKQELGFKVRNTCLCLRLLQNNGDIR